MARSATKKSEQSELCSDVVALSDLDANKYAKVLSWKRKANISPVTDNNTRETEKSIGLSEYGDAEVKRLRQQQKQLSAGEIERIVKDYQGGKTTYELAEKYGCHRGTITRHLKNQGVTVTNSKIQDTSGEIIRLYEMGQNAFVLADQFGVSYTTILKHLHDNDVKVRTRWDY